MPQQKLLIVSGFKNGAVVSYKTLHRGLAVHKLDFLPIIQFYRAMQCFETKWGTQHCERLYTTERFHALFPLPQKLRTSWRRDQQTITPKFWDAEQKACSSDYMTIQETYFFLIYYCVDQAWSDGYNDRLLVPVRRVFRVILWKSDYRRQILSTLQ